MTSKASITTIGSITTTTTTTATSEKGGYSIMDAKSSFRAISKCYDVCVKSFADKHLNPMEKECMMQCMENMFNTHIELIDHSKLDTREYKFA